MRVLLERPPFDDEDPPSFIAANVDSMISGFGPGIGMSPEHGDMTWQPDGQPIDWEARDPGDVHVYYRGFLSDSIDEAERPVTQQELNALERQLDRLFAAAEIDVEFTRHFLDRVNDARNGRQITVDELRRVYQAVWTQHRKAIEKADVDWVAIIRDLPTAINIPVVFDLDPRTGELQMVAKTIMRKRKFQGREQQLVTKSTSESVEPGLRSALERWKGAASDLQFQVLDIVNGGPDPSSGSGKHMRAEAEALLAALRPRGANAKPLYRGGPEGQVRQYPVSATSSLKTARQFARRHRGHVYQLFGGKALRIADYLGRGRGDLWEDEWIVMGGKWRRVIDESQSARVIVDGARPFEDTALDEAVKQLRTHLDGQHQVLDHGTVGFFRVFSVMPITEEARLTHLQYVVPALKGSGFSATARRAVETWFSRPHSIADYQKAVRKDGKDAPYRLDPAVANWTQIRANIEEATRAITKLGARRQRDTLILVDLSGQRNRITGGGVGGYAYRKTHAIEADTAEMSKPFGVELLVHEWGHKLFFNLPKHATDYVRAWFKENIIQRPEVVAQPLVTDEMKLRVAAHLWSGFRDYWRREEGIYPEDYFKTARDVAGSADTEVLRTFFLQPNGDVIGRLLKGLRNPEGGEGLRKGQLVRAISARASGPDAWMAVGWSKEGVQKGAIIQTTKQVLAELLDIDLSATAKLGRVSNDTVQNHLSRMRGHSSSSVPHFARENLFAMAFDEGLNSARKYLERNLGFEVHTEQFFPRYMEFIKAWVQAAHAQGDNLDVEKTFRVLIAKHVDYRGLVAVPTRQRLSSPSGASLREIVQQLGLSPSSYGASNADEFWAELIAYTALKPNKVSKQVREVFKNVLQGSTKIAESQGVRVLVGASPF